MFCCDANGLIILIKSNVTLKYIFIFLMLDLIYFELEQYDAEIYDLFILILYLTTMDLFGAALEGIIYIIEGCSHYWS